MSTEEKESEPNFVSVRWKFGWKLHVGCGMTRALLLLHTPLPPTQTPLMVVKDILEIIFHILLLAFCCLAGWLFHFMAEMFAMPCRGYFWSFEWITEADWLQLQLRPFIYGIAEMFMFFKLPSIGLDGAHELAALRWQTISNCCQMMVHMNEILMLFFFFVE